VPTVRFRLSFTVDLALPADALALGLPPARVPALGLADAFVFVDAGTFFDDFNVTVTPDRGAEPFARAFGAVVVERDLALWLDRWPAAMAAVGIARAITNPMMIRVFFMSVSLRASRLGGCSAQVSTAQRLVPR